MVRKLEPITFTDRTVHRSDIIANAKGEVTFERLINNSDGVKLRTKMVVLHKRIYALGLDVFSYDEGNSLFD